MPDWDRWFNEPRLYGLRCRLPAAAARTRWQDETGDVKCALGWVVAHVAGEYRIDPARISTTGFSAGGTLAMLAAYSVGDPRLPPSCATCPGHGSVGNRTLRHSRHAARIYDNSPSLALVRDASAATYRRQPRHRVSGPLRRDVSPLAHRPYVSRLSPPTISFCSARMTASFRVEQLFGILDAAMTRVGVAGRNLSAAGHRSCVRRQLGRLRHANRSRQDLRASLSATPDGGTVDRAPARVLALRSLPHQHAGSAACVTFRAGSGLGAGADRGEPRGGSLHSDGGRHRRRRQWRARRARAAHRLVGPALGARTDVLLASTAAGVRASR